MLSFGPEKILVILVLAVILLGPDKLPSVARQLGAAWKSLRDFQQKVEKEVRENVPDLPSSHDIARFARSPVTFLNSLAELDGGEDPVADPGVAGAADPAPEESWPTDPAAPAVADVTEPSDPPAVRAEEALQPNGLFVPDDPSMN